jgi:DNA-binding NtrC family response regulator
MSGPTPQAAPTPGTPRVMLIDDEPYILEALQRQLRAEACEVRPFQDPLVALESFFQDGDYAVIVSDNLMPGLKGLELLARAREFAPQARRVLLTGHTELNQAIAAFNEGVIHRFINKPWDAADLIGVLREELDKFRAGQRAGQQQAQAESVGRSVHSRLQRTVHDLKQALTQVALYEDGNHTRRLHVTPQMRRLSFLVVDGNPSVRRLLVTTLQKAGILSVSAVGSAEEALAYLRRVPAVDVVLSEWTLSGMDGMALFEALRADQTPSAKAIFMLMTAREHRQAVEFALNRGVDYYLIKPFHLDSLFEQIDKRLRRNRKETPETRIAKLRRLHVVVANADQDSRYRIQQMLLINGIQNVTIADSAPKALRVVQERKVDLLVLDCNLLDVYWPDLRPQLEELSGEQLAPSVVVTSVSPMPQEFERIYEAGFATFLPGPPRQRELFDAVFKALEADERSDILDAGA